MDGRDALIARALLPWERRARNRARRSRDGSGLSIPSRLLLQEWARLIRADSPASLRRHIASRLRRDGLSLACLDDPTPDEGTVSAIPAAASRWALSLHRALAQCQAQSCRDWIDQLATQAALSLSEELSHRQLLSLFTASALGDLKSWLTDRLAALWPAEWPDTLSFTACLNRAPMAARFSMVVLDQWHERTVELADRLRSDHSALVRLFGIAADAVADHIRPGLSDPHDHGRSVCRIVFSDGTPLYLKLRPLDAELAWAGLLDWHNSHLPDLALHSAPTLNRTTHGWMAEVSACSPQALPPDQQKDWIRRAGALTAILHVLGSRDLHRHNLLAAADQLVLVDAECILPTGAGDGLPLLQSGLLADWWHDSKTAVDHGGLSAGASALLGDHASGFLDDFLDGFERSHSLFCRHADWLIADPWSPLRRFKNCRLRHLHRPTQSYGMVMASATSPAALADGRSFALRLEALATGSSTSDCAPENWPLIRAEQRAMAQLDVPAFSVMADQTALCDAHGEIAGPCLEQSPLQRLEQRIAWLGGPDGEQDRLQQRKLFEVLYRRGTAGPMLVRDIAHQLAEQAITGPDGNPRWLTPVIEGGFGRIHTSHDHGLYNGSAGIALFLASQAAADGQPDSPLGQLAIRSLTALPAGHQAERGTGLGGGTGGLMYVLAEAGRLLQAPQLWHHALSLLRSIAGPGLAEQRKSVRQQGAMDLLGGQAGFLCGLARLSAASADEEATAALRGYGQQFIDHLSDLGDSQRMDGLFGTGLTGLSHGASGLAVALATLARHLPDLAPTALALAQQAIAAEDRFWLEDTGNWQDLRLRKTGTEPAQGLSWCHGAPGMALARLAVWSALPAGSDQRSGLEDWLNHALTTTINGPDRGEDGLCCGLAGRIWTLLDIGQRMQRADLLHLARQQFEQGIAHKTGWRLTPDLVGCPVPASLFTGIAGIGLLALRITTTLRNQGSTGQITEAGPIALPNPLLPDGWHPVTAP